MELRKYTALVAALVLVLTVGCCPKHGPVNREEALYMARQAITVHGYTLSDYRLFKYKDDLTSDGKEWFFLFVCKREGIDCGFSVSVNRKTGEAEVQSLP